MSPPPSFFKDEPTFTVCQLPRDGDMHLSRTFHFASHALDLWAGKPGPNDTIKSIVVGNSEVNEVNEWKQVDTTKYDFPSEIWITRPLWEMVLKVVGLLPIFVVGSLANGSLIHVIGRTKSLQTTTNLLIANMAIADLGTCLVCPWMFLSTDLFQNYVLGAAGCRLDGLFVHALTLVAVFSLSAVSYERVSAVVFNSSGKLTERATHVLLYATWIVGVALAAPLAFFRNYHERRWKNFLETYCTEDSVLVYPYWHIFAGLSVWAPLTIMAVSYSAILIKLDRYRAQALTKRTIGMHYKGRVTRVLALIVLALIICRVPFTALIIQRAQLLQQRKSGRAEAMYLLWYISRYLVLVNAAINPMLYGCSSSLLRKELARCRATSWLFCRRRKASTSKSFNASQSQLLVKSERFRCLKPRSPCIRSQHHGGHGAVPSISSKIASTNLRSNTITDVPN